MTDRSQTTIQLGEPPDDLKAYVHRIEAARTPDQSQTTVPASPKAAIGHLYIVLGMLAARHGMGADTTAMQHIKAALKELEHAD